jgi:CRISPR-associated endonuclease/helicase Cas3
MLDFGDMFERVTGHKPMSWQCRLYGQWLADDIKPVIDLPTGMGKTNVMAIWLLARARQVEENREECLPRRLVYVVDRRTVVDQATTLAEKIKSKAEEAGIEAPAISTLRGQFADNRDWVRDPSKPAIIIGTVDMIGSRLLFSGYRSSFKQRPLDAGLLGQDSLLILDEAHLSEPFAKLLRDIGSHGPFQAGQGRPMQVVRMSATVSKGDANPFQLTPADLDGESENNVIAKRYHAEKHLHIHEDIADVKTEIVKEAAKLAVDNSRVVVFVQSPDDATTIASKIREYGDKKTKPFGNAVEALTGTMRGLERDELMKKTVMQRFLKPRNETAEGPAILVSTSAGEVGFDLNADHLVCDASPLDSVIQRLGRVNRRGEACATVHLFAAKPREKKRAGDEAGESASGHTYETASYKAVELLKGLPKLPDDSRDASPKAFANLEKPPYALTPKPAIVEITDILLDAWSMTTIVEPMPGRPPVADWLRGVAEDLPDTTIAWRAELDLDGFGSLDIDDIEEWFDAHRVLPHETLTLPAHKAAKLLVQRRNKLEKHRGAKLKNRICIVDRGGLRKIDLTKLIDELSNGLLGGIVNADIILPASFGGIQRHIGLFDAGAPESQAATDAAAFVVGTDKTPDVADEKAHEMARRCRLLKTDGDEQPLVGEMPPDPGDYSRFTLDLPTEDDTVRQLISLVPKRQRAESGTQRQSLADHVNAVERHAAEVADRLKLSNHAREALSLAARWHDHGKNRERWQRLVQGQITPAGRPWMKETMAKSGGKMLRDSNGYRHEFGSLREFACECDGKIGSDVFDLAMHLIATHHGRGRPHFPKGGFDPDARAKSPEIATGVMQRFGRLQKKYGWWYLAWLENLLRCADALASAENNK